MSWPDVVFPVEVDYHTVEYGTIRRKHDGLFYSDDGVLSFPVEFTTGSAFGDVVWRWRFASSTADPDLEMVG